MEVVPEFLHPRSSGVLLPVASLPGPYGIGELGSVALEWLEYLNETGQRLWQILPIHPTGVGHSPYQSSSAMAYNPMLIGLDQLHREDLLCDNDFIAYPKTSGNTIAYETILPFRYELLKKAAENFLRRGKLDEYENFCQGEKSWLEDYVLFECLSRRFAGKTWNHWPEEFCNRNPEALKKFSEENAHGIHILSLWQYFFHRQWQLIRRRAEELSIKIIGDMPIFVSHHSADVWANRELFDLCKDGSPRTVAGVPPDYFSSSGQRWGNPLYLWDRHRNTNYAWWTRRLLGSMKLYDAIRIDHFRGFADYWEIPAACPTAMEGRWMPGPGEHFFRSILSQVGPLPFIAEDLGILSDEAVHLRENLGIPGLRIVLFAFDSDDPSSHFLPMNFSKNCIAYTGTHDNNTAMGALDSCNFAADGSSIGQKRRQILKKYLPREHALLPLHEALLHWISKSNAQWVIFPMQDVLGLGREARLNVPGQAEGNWQWKLNGEEKMPKIRFLLQKISQR
ncbi:MAG: 4-alpha-glucanotransferase [Puniceicoccales bacterium]|jgi:4-alpha-glucanotransferase|nr:4-alpha-glucanotransferase [Puniceicoccales bacterium]